jgi:hypothetical protein
MTRRSRPCRLVGWISAGVVLLMSAQALLPAGSLSISHATNCVHESHDTAAFGGWPSDDLNCPLETRTGTLLPLSSRAGGVLLAEHAAVTVRSPNPEPRADSNLIGWAKHFADNLGKQYLGTAGEGYYQYQLYNCGLADSGFSATCDLWLWKRGVAQSGGVAISIWRVKQWAYNDNGTVWGRNFRIDVFGPYKVVCSDDGYAAENLLVVVNVPRCT